MSVPGHISLLLHSSHGHSLIKLSLTTPGCWSRQSWLFLFFTSLQFVRNPALSLISNQPSQDDCQGVASSGASHCYPVLSESSHSCILIISNAISCHSFKSAAHHKPLSTPSSARNHSILESPRHIYNHRDLCDTKLIFTEPSLALSFHLSCAVTTQRCENWHNLSQTWDLQLCNRRIPLISEKILVTQNLLSW